MASRWWVAVMLAAGVSSWACVPDGPLKLPAPAGLTAPVAQADGWRVAAPSAVGLASESVARALALIHDPEHLPNVRSLLVARRGTLAVESYVRTPADRERRHAQMSVTKSVTSLLVGIALDQGRLPDLDQTIGTWLPEKLAGDATKSGIRLRDLLTMRSGIEFGNDRFSLDMDLGGHPDGIAFVLTQPLLRPPGSTFRYQDADVHLAGAMVQKAVGMSLQQIAEQHLFGPLGIRDWSWWEHGDGTTYGAYGLHLRPRDMLRLGQLCLDQGVWQGQQVVSREWLAESTRAQVDPGPAPGRAGYHYGHYWWVAPDGSGYTAWGHGGQYIYVRPASELVVVVTADPHSDGERVSVQLEQMHRLVMTLIADLTP